MGGVIGFWCGVFLLGIVYLIFVCVRRVRKGLQRSANGGRPFLILLMQTKMRYTMPRRKTPPRNRSRQK